MNQSVETRKQSPWQILVTTILVAMLVLVAIACLFPIGYGNNKEMAKRTSCISNLKQIGTGILIYESDNNESLPPYFTFEGNKQTDHFTDATQPYLKNVEMLVCPSDFTANRDKPDATLFVGDKVKMSYIHCLSLKGIIPDFSDGKRSLSLEKTALDLAKTPHIREPIRSYGNPDGDMPGPAYLSAHKRYPIIGFLDSHVDAKNRLMLDSQL